jgi:hypothetical protein
VFYVRTKTPAYTHYGRGLLLARKWPRDIVNKITCGRSGANGDGDWRASPQSGKVLMSNADQFWELARELRWAAHSKTKKERETLIERARTWTQAALIAEKGSFPRKIRRRLTSRATPPRRVAAE